MLAHGPFDLVLGAALQYEEWWERLWVVLARTLQSGGGDGRAVLVHTVGTIQPPVAFCVLERVGGESFGMLARDGRDHGSELGTFSDFELVRVGLRRADGGCGGDRAEL